MTHSADALQSDLSELNVRQSQLLCRRGDAAVYQCNDIRWLSLGDDVVQSAMLPKCPQRLLLPYLQAMTVALSWVDRGKVLNLGLGGGALVQHLHHHHSQLEIISVEQSTDVVELARAYFHLPPEIEVTIDSAEAFLHHHPDHYQLMFIDLPMPVLTQEGFLERCRQQLPGGGILAANLLYRQQQDLMAVLQPLRQLFSNIYLLDVANCPNLIVFAGEQLTHKHCDVVERAQQLGVERQFEQLTALPHPPQPRL